MPRCFVLRSPVLSILPALLVLLGGLQACSSSGGDSEGEFGLSLTHLPQKVSAVYQTTIDPVDDGNPPMTTVVTETTVPGTYTLRAAIDGGPNVIGDVTLYVYRPGGFSDQYSSNGGNGIHEVTIGALDLCDRVDWRWQVQYFKGGPGGEEVSFLSTERALIVDKQYNPGGSLSQALCSE